MPTGGMPGIQNMMRQFQSSGGMGNLGNLMGGKR